MFEDLSEKLEFETDTLKTLNNCIKTLQLLRNQFNKSLTKNSNSELLDWSYSIDSVKNEINKLSELFL